MLRFHVFDGFVHRFVPCVRRFRTLAAIKEVSLVLQSSRDAMASGRELPANSFLIFIWTTE